MKQMWLPMPIDVHVTHHIDSWCADIKYKKVDMKTLNIEWHEERVFGHSVKQCMKKFEIAVSKSVNSNEVIKDWRIKSCYRMFVKKGGVK